MSPIWERALRLVDGLSAAPADQPVGVLDIGSNSVRLVVYERLSRALTPVFNEKASAKLGHGVAQTGRIARENAVRAIHAFERFTQVADHLQLTQLHVIATSAVREAENGPDLMRAVHDITGVEGRVLSGEEEAHYAACGVISGIPGFNGLIGDLGGGSLELSTIDDGFDSIGETLALGAIRLQDDSAGDPKKAYKIARKRLGESSAFESAHESTFAAIGGTWRALAKLHQHVTHYPLHMVHAYRADVGTMLELCDRLIRDELDAELLSNIGSTRRTLAPFGAAAMKAVLEVGEFEDVLFSSLGVREGYLFSLLSDTEKRVDPLIEAVKLFNSVRSRVPEFAEEIVDFTDRFMAATDLRETELDLKLRHAACYLSDIGWRGHPDYRGEQSVDLVAFSAMAGVDHCGRAFLAEALAVRYMGLSHGSRSQSLTDLIPNDRLERARMIGALLRFVYNLAPAIPGVFPSVLVQRYGDMIKLAMPGSVLSGGSERVESRLKQLRATLGMDVELIEAED